MAWEAVNPLLFLKDLDPSTPFSLVAARAKASSVVEGSKEDIMLDNMQVVTQSGYAKIVVIKGIW